MITATLEVGLRETLDQLNASLNRDKGLHRSSGFCIFDITQDCLGDYSCHAALVGLEGSERVAVELCDSRKRLLAEQAQQRTPATTY